MKNCVEYLEIISAHADGELTEFEKRRIEEHIGVCENCSALLDLYREISAASAQSCAPVPEALRSGVMDKVMSGSFARAGGGAVPGYMPQSYSAGASAGGAAGSGYVPQSADYSAGAKAGGGADAKKRRPVRATLTRYLPVAACLAVVLLALPFVVIYYSGQTDNIVSAPEAAQNGFMAPGAAADGDLASTGRAGGMAESDDAALGGGGPLLEPPAEDAGYTPFGELELSDVPPPEEYLPVEPAGGYDTEDVEAEPWDLPDPADAYAALNELYDDVYAWIEITGELPELLLGYEPERLAYPLRRWLNFDVTYRISRDVADELIEILARDGIEVMIVNVDSQYALVLYSR